MFIDTNKLSYISRHWDYKNEYLRHKAHTHWTDDQVRKRDTEYIIIRDLLEDIS